MNTLTIRSQRHYTTSTIQETVPNSSNSRQRKGRAVMCTKTRADWYLGNVQKGANFKHQGKRSQELTAFH